MGKRKRRPSPWATAVRNNLRLIRRETIAWSLIFAAVAASTVQAYTSAYPTAASRQAAALLIEGNRAFQALNGVARAIDTVGGFVAWRAGGPLAVLAGLWGLLAATRLLRGEEDAGRWELTVAGAVSPAGANLAALSALGVAFGISGIVFGGALVATGLDVGGAAMMGLQVAGSAAFFASAGALAAQLVPIRRRASAIAGILLGVSFLLRVVADGSETLGWLRPFTPLGWIEDVRPFAGSTLMWFLPVLGGVVAFSVAAVRLGAVRDLGRGLLGTDDAGRSSRWGLGSPLGFAARAGIAPILLWTVGVAAFGAVYGVISVDIADFLNTSPTFRDLVSRMGGFDLGTAGAFMGLAFSFIAVPVILFATFRLLAAREEEAASRLDAVLSRAVSRRAWLASQASVAVWGAGVVAVGTAVAAWGAATARGADVGLGGMIVGGLNLLPVTMVFLGIGMLAFGAMPRTTGAAMFGTVAGTYLLQLIGSFGKLPEVILDLSPFHQVAPVPAVDLDVVPALVMGAVGLAFAAAGAELFARRDIAAA